MLLNWLPWSEWIRTFSRGLSPQRRHQQRLQHHMAQTPEEATAARAELELRLRKTETAIDRLLDRLAGEEASESIMERLKIREAERDQLRRELTDSADAQPIALPSRTELDSVYRAQVERLASLLTGSEQIVAANALRKELLGELRVWGDPTARDGVAIEIRGGGIPDLPNF